MREGEGNRGSGQIFGAGAAGGGSCIMMRGSDEEGEEMEAEGRQGAKGETGLQRCMQQLEQCERVTRAGRSSSHAGTMCTRPVYVKRGTREQETDVHDVREDPSFTLLHQPPPATDRRSAADSPSFAAPLHND